MPISMISSYGDASLAPTVESNDVSCHAHTVQFYADDEFLLDGASRFLGAALGAGEAEIVIATPLHRDGLAARLQARGVDVDLAASQGRYIAVDAAETLSMFMLDGWPDSVRFVNTMESVLARARDTSTEPTRRLAAFGEM